MGTCQCKIRSHRIHIYVDNDVDDISPKLRGSDKFSNKKYIPRFSPDDLLSSGNSSEVLIDFGVDQPNLEETHINEDSSQKLLRSNVGAIKMLIRNTESREAFHLYLCSCTSMGVSRVWKSHLYTSGDPHGTNWSELLNCYQNLEEIKYLSDDDQVLCRTTALVWRYKTMYESVRLANGVAVNSSSFNKTISNRSFTNLSNHSDSASNLVSGNLSNHKIVEYLIWDCIGKLKHIDIMNTPKDLLVNYIVAVENALLSYMAEHFEGFLKSAPYRDWQLNHVRNLKMRRTNSKGSMHSHGNQDDKSVGDRLPTCSVNYPNVLIVDDSNIILKLAGLTLEKDGHRVEKAINGEIALSLMSSHQYDVVLLDLNLPVMDGFETVRQFRMLEKERIAHLAAAMESFPSDVSSMSEENNSEQEEDSFYNPPAPQLSQPTNNEELDLSMVEKPSLRHSNSSMGLDIEMRMDDDDDEGDVSPLAKAAEQAAIASGRFQNEPSPEGKQKFNGPFRQLIIGMSSSTDEATQRKAFESGMDYFLPKPFSLEKFIEAIMISDGQLSQHDLSHCHSKSLLNPQQSILSSTSATSSVQITLAGTGNIGKIDACKKSLWSYR